jgi:isovaleryl-CoA dehydrogenase
MAQQAVASGVETVLAAVRDVARERIAPDAAGVDRDLRFPDEGLQALSEVGALGLLIPTDHGGAGGGLGALARACETIGGACASTGMVFLMHSVAAATVAAGGGPGAVALLGRLNREAIGTLAFSERGTGAHFYAPELRTERRNGAISLTGVKSFVTSGGHADVMLVLIQREGEGLDCYAVEKTADGVSFEGRWQGLGMRGNSSIAVRFDNVALHSDALVGEPGTGAELVFGAVAPTFLVGLAAVNVGIAQAAVSAATDHVRSRQYADGSNLAEVQAVQDAVANIDVETRSARALLREAATLGDDGHEGALVALMESKVLCTDVAARVTQGALELCGGQGYTPSLPIERHLRDARAGAVMAPTNGVLRTWAGKALLGLPVP